MTTHTVTLRPATGGDGDFAFETKRASFKSYVEEALGWDEEEQRARHGSRFSSQSFRIIQSDGIDVGVLAVVEERGRLKLNQIFIRPEHQGRGIGAACMQLVIDESTAKRLPIELRVLYNNPRAIAFYNRFGFEPFDRSKSHVHMRRDRISE